MSNGIAGWAVFSAFIFSILVLDLGVFERKPHTISGKEALRLTGVLIAVALLFDAGIYYWLGETHAEQFLAGYLIEESLSVDNLFVFLLIFAHFRVPSTRCSYGEFSAHWCCVPCSS